MSDRKEQQIIRQVQMCAPKITARQVRDFMYADWPESDHSAWLESASVREIANWVLAGQGN